MMCVGTCVVEVNCSMVCRWAVAINLAMFMSVTSCKLKRPMCIASEVANRKSCRTLTDMFVDRVCVSFLYVLGTHWLCLAFSNRAGMQPKIVRCSWLADNEAQVPRVLRFRWGMHSIDYVAGVSCAIRSCGRVLARWGWPQVYPENMGATAFDV